MQRLKPLVELVDRDRAVAIGVEQLEDLLDEGRVLFRQRIDDRVAGDRDFIAEELLRVAEARKGQ